MPYSNPRLAPVPEGTTVLEGLIFYLTCYLLIITLGLIVTELGFRLLHPQPETLRKTWRPLCPLPCRVIYAGASVMMFNMEWTQAMRLNVFDEPRPSAMQVAGDMVFADFVLVGVGLYVMALISAYAGGAEDEARGG